MAARTTTIPATTWIFGILGAGFLVRGMWNATRALVAEGGVVGCPGGSGCDPVLTVETKVGAEVFSAGSGTVVSAAPGWVHVALDDEPIVLAYFDVDPSVQPGQGVGRGQPIGSARNGVVRFGVWAVQGQTLSPIEPSSWLASRGFAVAASLQGDKQPWCAGGSNIHVPKDVHDSCGMGMPAQPDFLLFPVSISQG